MDRLFEFGLAATEWLQASYPSLETFMLLLHALGGFEFYLALAPLLYWCVNKTLGSRLLYLLTLTGLFNAVLKHLIGGPRPFWLDPSLGLIDEVGFGIPSGHAQLAATAFFLIAAWYRRTWLWLVAGFWVLVMGVSRIYLGVHFVQDVALGIALGIVMLAACLLWVRYAMPRFDSLILGQRLLVIIAGPLAILAVYGLLLWLLPRSPALASADIYAVAWWESVDETVRSAALVISGGIGLALERSRVRFQVTGTWYKRAARYLLGFALTVAIWQGLALAFDAVTPANALWLALPLRFVRYFALGLWVAYYAPASFVALKLAAAGAEPEVQLTLSHHARPSAPSNGSGTLP